MATAQRAMPAIRGAKRCKAIAPAELRYARCIMPDGASGHRKLNAANHGRLGLPVLMHRSEDAEHWTIYGVVRIERQATDEIEAEESE